MWTQLLSLGLAKIQICSKNGKMSSDNGSSKEKKFLIENILRPEFGISKNSIFEAYKSRLLSIVHQGLSGLLRSLHTAKLNTKYLNTDHAVFESDLGINT